MEGPYARGRRAWDGMVERFRRMPPRTRRAAGVVAGALVLLGVYQGLVTWFPEATGWLERPGAEPLTRLLVPPAPEEALPEEPPAPAEEPASVQEPAAQPAASGTPLDPSRFLPPVEGDVVRGFGWGLDETMGDYRYHAGVDLAAPAGAPVRASYGGTVTDVRRDGRLGWVVEVTHAPGVMTRYAGLGEVKVSRGQVVAPGDPLGTVGTVPAEAALPPHLHWELIWEGKPADPARVLGGGS